MALTDEASHIRKGEELPIDKVETFIRDEIKGIDGQITIGQFPGRKYQILIFIMPLAYFALRSLYSRVIIAILTDRRRIGVLSPGI